MIPTSIDGTDITGATIDGTDVTEITVDGDTVFTAGPPPGAFDLTNFSFDASINGAGSNLTGVYVSNDGTKIFESDRTTEKITQHNLGTAFDITSVSSTNSINTQDSTPVDLTFNDDGTKMYEAGEATDTIYVYNLTTPFDIQNFTLSSFPTRQLSNAQPKGITFNKDGTRFYESHNPSNEIHQINLATPFDGNSDISSTSVPILGGFAGGMSWSFDGLTFFEGDAAGNQVFQTPCTNAFDVTTRDTGNTITPNLSNLGAPIGISFSRNGDFFYVADTSNEQLLQYSL